MDLEDSEDSEDSDSGDAAEAMSWLLVAQLAGRLPEGYRLSEEHPGGGQYDALALRSPVHRPWVLLNRAGRVHVHQAPDHEEVVGGDEVWLRLRRGSLSVSGLANDVLRVMDLPRTGPIGMRGGQALDVAAAVLRVAALYRLGWRCVWGIEDTSGYGSVGPRRHLFAGLHDSTVEMDVTWDDPAGWGPVPGPPDYWFLLDREQKHVGCFNVAGSIQAGVGAQTPLPNAPAEPPWQTATRHFGHLIREKASRDPVVVSPGLGLTAVLEAFNRKERDHLLRTATGGPRGQELHGPSQQLSDAFRERLSFVTGQTVPSRAWTAMDYHLSWLHAALQWRAEHVWPGQTSELQSNTTSDGVQLVSGNQEDVDMIVAWAGDEADHILLIEAKAYGHWTQPQLTSKLTRLSSIISSASTPRPCQVRLVLAAPQPPAWSVTTPVPDFLVNESGKPTWLPFSVPGERLRTSRTDAEGRPSQHGQHWRIIGPDSGL